MTPVAETLLVADGLSKRFPVGRPSLRRPSGAFVQAVSAVSLQVAPGETLGLVGESGCGKSTLARLLGLLYLPDEGSVRLHGRDVTRLPRRRLRDFRRSVQMVFQDPFASLNPRLPVGALLAEPLRVHRLCNRRDQHERSAELLRLVGLSPDSLRRYPHEFSGGQRQRIAIARALALHPQLIIADEAVSALDVSVQSQILNLLAELKQRLGLAYLFISHDLAVVDHLADRVAVMYLGRIVEISPRDDLFRAPAHPYTRALINAVPAIQAGGKRRSGTVIGDVPSALAPPPGCPYHPRCPRAEAVCRERLPLLTTMPGRAESHRAACHIPLPNNNNS